MGSPDDRQKFVGGDAVMAWRQRLSRTTNATLKYSYRQSRYTFLNPDALSPADANSFSSLVSKERRHSPEVRVDVQTAPDSTLRFGYSWLHSNVGQSGTLGTIDPATGAPVFSPFSVSAGPNTHTAWVEAQKTYSNNLDLTVGGYWGRESGAASIVLPKMVAVYRPDTSSWVSFTALPIFRSDALELAPVEAMADPLGLDHLDRAMQLTQVKPWIGRGQLRPP
jgi:hypothetical protein